MARIKKIKVGSEWAYPVTITNAIKDFNFKNEDNSIMTQSLINSQFKSKIDLVVEAIKDFSGSPEVIKKDDITVGEIDGVDALIINNLKTID